MAVKLPDPLEQARKEAAVINLDPHRFLRAGFERVMADSPYLDPDSLLAGLEAFHKERMQKIPPADKYPEAKPWVEHALAADRELQRLTGMSDHDMAMFRSLGHYLTFRGYKNAKRRVAEKCRVAFIPETDRGPIHMKNVDDPITFWKPDPKPVGEMPSFERLVTDGVGSGLHIDDEPEEIFPLPVHAMMHAHCSDVPSAVEFVRRYSQFWGGGNIVLHDARMRSAAIEKASHNFVEVFPPDPCGGSHVSGMVCRDPNSPEGVYLWRKRREYLRQFGQPEDSQEMAFWNVCARAEQMLAELMSKPRVKVAELFKLLTTPWPDGLNACGGKSHPDQGYEGFTLLTFAWLPREKKVYRWQRSADRIYPKEPEVYSF